MHAVLCVKPFELAVEACAEPQRHDREVLVRIRRVGLCGTDYHIYAGKHPYLAYPRVIGHEISGEVIESDPRSPFRPGQLVTLNPYFACGECVACRKGRPNCCASLQVLGVHTDGGMREILSVPESAVIDATGLSLEQAAMVEFLSVGAHAIRRARVQPEERTLVVGAGPIGAAAALFARLAGARVTLMDKIAARVDHARDRLAIDSVLHVGSTTDEELRDLTGGEMFDCVVDATGSSAAMSASLRFVGHGGTYVLLGVVMDDVCFPGPELHKRETTLLGSRNALKDDFDLVIQRILEGSIPTECLHTHSIAALEVPQRMPELIANKDRVMKAIVNF